MAICVAPSKDFGKDSSNAKCAIEHLEDPDPEEPDPMTEDEQKDRLKWFTWPEATKQCMDCCESSKNGKRKLHSSLWGQCTLMVKNELEASDDCDDMKSEEDACLFDEKHQGCHTQLEGPNMCDWQHVVCQQAAMQLCQERGQRCLKNTMTDSSGGH